MPTLPCSVVGFAYSPGCIFCFVGSLYYANLYRATVRCSNKNCTFCRAQHKLTFVAPLHKLHCCCISLGGVPSFVQWWAGQWVRQLVGKVVGGRAVYIQLVVC